MDMEKRHLLPLSNRGQPVGEQPSAAVGGRRSESVRHTCSIIMNALSLLPSTCSRRLTLRIHGPTGSSTSGRRYPCLQPCLLRLPPWFQRNCLNEPFDIGGNRSRHFVAANRRRTIAHRVERRRDVGGHEALNPLAHHGVGLRPQSKFWKNSSEVPEALIYLRSWTNFSIEPTSIDLPVGLSCLTLVRRSTMPTKDLKVDRAEKRNSSGQCVVSLPSSADISWRTGSPMNQPLRSACMAAWVRLVTLIRAKIA